MTSKAVWPEQDTYATLNLEPLSAPSHSMNFLRVTGLILQTQNLSIASDSFRRYSPDRHYKSNTTFDDYELKPFNHTTLDPLTRLLSLDALSESTR